ncbi:MAG: hypothetical protein IJQ89_00645 [Bacteroidales bacterium]|nr:hypothetical protein [Bacteroidales bacterium]
MKFKFCVFETKNILTEINDDFRVVIWRRNEERVQEGGEEGVQEKVQERVQEDGNIIKIVLDIRGNTVSAEEIKKKMNLKGRTNFTNRYLHPSINLGYVSMLYPDSPKRRDQAYYLTEKGLALYSELFKSK